MPGIAGIFSPHPSLDNTKLLRLMLDTMRHEPSYVSGICSAPTLGIVAGWVAHEKSFASKASGTNANGGISLAFSGECFSTGETVPDEPSRNPQGWLMHHYEKSGANCFAQLNGLFSGLLIDHRLRRIFLFNDRYALERIYVHESNGVTYFASEAKALLRILPELRAFDESGVAQYLAFGCTLEWKTIFRGVDLLPPAACWSYEPESNWQRKVYFSPQEWESQTPLSEEQFETEFDACFRRILPRYTTAPERLGISLTGGLDTRMIMALLPETNPKIPCYTFSGRTEKTIDAKLATQIARSKGLSHQLIRIGNDFLDGFGDFVDKSVYVSDGCCGATGSHEIYFNRAVRQLAPVRLTGNFGSEVLRSMSTFKPAHLSAGLFSAMTKSMVETASTISPSAAPHPVTFAAFREIPWNLVGTLLTGRSQVSFRTPYLDNELVALAYRAPQSSRTTPLPALRFLKKANPALSNIPTDRGHIGTDRGLAWMLRRAYAEITFKIDYLHNEGLPGALTPFDPLLNALTPTSVIGLHKFLPYRRWFQNELALHVKEIVTDQRTRSLPFVDGSFFDKMLNEHNTGHKNFTREINAILTLEAVDRQLLHMPSLTSH